MSTGKSTPDQSFVPVGNNNDKENKPPAETQKRGTKTAINKDNNRREANMSFDRQHASFLSSMSAAASKLGSGAGTKRSLAPPSPSPSVGSTTSAAAAGSSTPRKDRETPSNVVYSQPALTGTGDSIISQMAYAVSWLRSKDEPQHYYDVLGYLSITAHPENEQEFFVEQMRRHPHIQWIPDPNLSEQTWRSGTYVHRPKIPGVKSKTQLLAYLQKKTDASAVSVKDLKDGWPDCEAGISELEKEHKVLVIRAKKDGSARLVWLDDPSLFHEIDPQLKLMWARTEVPSLDTIVQRLVAAQQKPASEDPRVQAAQAPKAEKKKKPARRKTGKLTNTHMEHLLKDYSHVKR
jgi:transcription initiation factor TFIIE subunit beta